MRIVVLCGLIGLAGCSKPAAVEAPPVDAVPVVVQEAPAPRPLAQLEQPSHVPQDEYNVREREFLRQYGKEVVKDLAADRFKHGMKLADVIAMHKPDAVLVHGQFTTAVYAEVSGYLFGCEGHGTFLIARDGKLVRAHGRSCVWRPIFFDSLTNAELQEWARGYWDAFMQFAHANAPIQRLHIGGLAVAGPIAAIVHPCQW